ncbi:MAG: hypothetical protein ACLFSQ_00980 [Candidatus Zixiibacteriota bacterium]
MKKLFLILLITILSTCFAGEFYYGGFWKNYATATFIPDYFQDMTGYGQATGILNQTYRLNLSYSPLDFASVNASYELMAKVYDPDFDLPNFGFTESQQGAYRAFDLDNTIYPAPDFPEKSNLSILGNLDRAYIRLSWKADLYIGRQPIAWGTARMVKPCEVIVPYSYDALDTEERPGVDAIRLRMPIGMMSEIDMGYISGDEFEIEKSAIFGRGKFYALETDFSLLAVKYKKSMLYGFDMMRSIGGTGTWLEAAYSDIEVDSSQIGDIEQDIFRLSAGADYSFSDKFYGWAEYHYNSAGKTFDEEYRAILNDPAYRSGELYLLGQHYLIPGASYSINPLLSASSVIYYNIVDGSALIVPSLEYNIAEDIYIAFGGYLGLGEPLENESGIFPKINSEFGSYTDMVYASFRIYY